MGNDFSLVYMTQDSYLNTIKLPDSSLSFSKALYFVNFVVFYFQDLTTFSIAFSGNSNL